METINMQQHPTILNITKSDNRYRFTFINNMTESFKEPLQKVWEVQVNPNTIATLCKMIEKAVEDVNNTMDISHNSLNQFKAAGLGLYREILSNDDLSIGELKHVLCEFQTPLLICADTFDIYWELLYIEEIQEFIGLKYDVSRKSKTCSIPDQVICLEHNWRCLMIVDPNEDEPALALPETVQETSHLRDWFNNNNINCDDYLHGKNATYDAVLNKLMHNEYDIIHFVGHIDFEKNLNKYALILNGGLPFTAENIRSQIKNTSIVFLNGYWSGKPKKMAKSLEIIEDLADSFIEAGVQLVIGSLFDVPEKGACAFAEKFYNCVLGGNTVGEAMRVARKHVKDEKEYGATWACFIMYGDPCLRIKIKDSEIQELFSELELSVNNFEPSCLQVIKQALEYGRPNGSINTLHLFTAMIEGDNSYLRDRLQDQRITPESLYNEFKEIFQILSTITSQPKQVVFSKNVKNILLNSNVITQAVGQDKITELDLLKSFIKKHGNEIGQILREKGVNIKALDPDSKTPDETCIGQFNPEDFTSDTWEILVYAIDIAGKLGNTVAGTLDLFEGMLQKEQGALTKAIKKWDVDPAPLKQVLYKRSKFAEEKLSDATLCNIKCSESITKILELAKENTLGCGRSRITDEDLLKAFVQQGGGQTGKLFSEQGLIMEALISKIFKETGDLDMSCFEDTAQRIIENALEYAQEKGHQLLGSRHLLYAMLITKESELTRMILQQGKNAEQLAELLDISSLMPAGETETDISAKASSISSGLIRILFVAEMSVINKQELQIGDALLLRELLGDTNSEAVRFLLEHGVGWQRTQTGRKKYST